VRGRFRELEAVVLVREFARNRASARWPGRGGSRVSLWDPQGGVRHRVRPAPGAINDRGHRSASHARRRPAARATVLPVQSAT